MAIQLDELKPLIQWLHLHPSWGGVLAFTFAFVESVAVLGLFMPGAVMMSVIGILIGSSVLPWLSTFLWASAGAFLGDALSFGMGYYYRDRIHLIWPFSRYPQLLQNSQTFFTNHGGKGIFIGRFIGPIRPMLPLIAGSLNMSIIRFSIVDLLSALVWAPVYMLPGIIIGAASSAVAPQATSRVIIYLLGIVLAIWLAFWLTKKLIALFVISTDRLFQALWRKIENSPSFASIRSLLVATHISDDHTQFGLAVFFILCLIAFIVLSVLAYEITPLLSINTATYHLFRSLYNPLWQKIMASLTLLFEPQVLLAMWFCVLIYLAVKKHWQAFLHWIGVACLSIGLAGVLKRALDIPRPIGIKFISDNGSYPSGHATMVAALIGLLAVFIVYGRDYFARRLTFGIATIIILLTAISRLYLGAHWLSDVVGSILLAITIVLGLTISFRRTQPPQISVAPLVLTACISVLVTWSVVMWRDYDKTISDYSPKYPTYEISAEDWWQHGLKDHPMFRNNRFGTPVQTMNIEWLGDVYQIKNTLSKQGWQAKFQNPLLRTIDYLGGANRSNILPLFPVVYNGKQPSLIMTKLVGQPRRLLILRLWYSYATVTDSDNKILIGTLNYQHGFGRDYIIGDYPQNYPSFYNLEPVTTVFVRYLQGYSWKKLDYASFPPLNNGWDMDWDGYVLLVRGKVS